MLKPNEAKAARCRKLALQAKNAEDRERWFSMERFWLRQTGPAEAASVGGLFHFCSGRSTGQKAAAVQ
jgi:hypothetical protein